MLIETLSMDCMEGGVLRVSRLGWHFSLGPSFPSRLEDFNRVSEARDLFRQTGCVWASFAGAIGNDGFFLSDCIFELGFKFAGVPDLRSVRDIDCARNV